MEFILDTADVTEIKKLNEDNYELQKSNQDLKFSQSENDITNKHLENHISTLQNEVSANKTSILSLQSELGTNKTALQNNINAIREVL